MIAKRCIDIIKIMSKLTEKEVIERLNHDLKNEMKENYQLREVIDQHQKIMRIAGGTLTGTANKKI